MFEYIISVSNWYICGSGVISPSFGKPRHGILIEIKLFTDFSVYIIFWVYRCKNIFFWNDFPLEFYSMNKKVKLYTYAHTYLLRVENYIGHLICVSTQKNFILKFEMLLFLLEFVLHFCNYWTWFIMSVKKQNLK